MGMAKKSCKKDKDYKSNRVTIWVCADDEDIGEPIVLILDKEVELWCGKKKGKIKVVKQGVNAKASKEDMDAAIRELGLKKGRSKKAKRKWASSRDMRRKFAASIAARRELKQETGLRVGKDCDLTLIDAIPLPEDLHDDGDRFVYVARLKKKVKSDTVKISPEHIGAPTWLPLSALESFLNIKANVPDPCRREHYLQGAKLLAEHLAKQ